MNLTVRAKNPVFWFNIALAVAAPVLTYFGLSGAEITTWPMVWNIAAQAARNPYVLFTVAASVWNALNDPTTAGLGDSTRAKGYTRPFRDGAV